MPIVRLRDAAQAPLTLQAVALSPTHQDNRLLECHLTVRVTPELYDRIDRHSLFNLKPELRGTLTGSFLPDAEITIEAALQPDRLTDLSDCQTSEEAIAHLQTLSETEPDHPLLNTESWYALRVTQQQTSGEVGYQTFWAYVNPAAIGQADFTSETIAEGMIRFFREQMNGSDDISTNVLEDTFNQIASSFEEWLDTTFEESDRAITEAIDEATDTLEELLETIDEADKELSTDQSIYQAMIDFFTEDDWSFTKLQGEPTLQLAFQGKGDRFLCFAKAREEQQQFVFYSVCPVKVPKSKRRAIAEFLTRVNFGTIIGNFELDMTDGEIRYKTSIDVAGDPLSSTLIKRLIYVNVLMMDDYLPGIREVLNGKTIEAALQEVEGEAVGSQS